MILFIKELKSPLPQRVFIDTFTDTNGTNIESHSSLSSSWSWLMHAGWTTGSYTIQSWELAKNNNSISLVYPVPLPAINSDNYGMSFQVKNFAADIKLWEESDEYFLYFKTLVKLSIQMILSASQRDETLLYLV